MTTRSDDIERVKIREHFPYITLNVSSLTCAIAIRPNSIRQTDGWLVGWLAFSHHETKSLCLSIHAQVRNQTTKCLQDQATNTLHAKLSHLTLYNNNKTICSYMLQFFKVFDKATYFRLIDTGLYSYWQTPQNSESVAILKIDLSMLNLIIILADLFYFYVMCTKRDDLYYKT